MSAAFRLVHKMCRDLLWAVACMRDKQLPHPFIVRAVGHAVREQNHNVAVVHLQRHGVAKLVLLRQTDGQRGRIVHRPFSRM